MNRFMVFIANLFSRRLPVRRAGNTLNRRDEYSLRRRLLARVLEERK